MFNQENQVNIVAGVIDAPEPFISFPKLYRFKGPWIITEKIDGTNAQLFISDTEFKVGSRTRWITPQNDNFGFATWAYTHQAKLTELLGPGRHYGEWYGLGIQRNYGLKEKRFSLFNTHRWTADMFTTLPQLSVVPILYAGAFEQLAFDQVMLHLKENGSIASPGFMNPEGIVVFDTQSGTGFKRTFDYDEAGKGGKRDQDGNIIA